MNWNTVTSFTHQHAFCFPEIQLNVIEEELFIVYNGWWDVAKFPTNHRCKTSAAIYQLTFLRSINTKDYAIKLPVFPSPLLLLN